MSLKEQFDKAAEEVRNLKAKPTDSELLELYGLFKQGTFGDNNTGKPGVFDLKGKAKWDSWNGRKGMSQNAAQAEYIALVKKLITTYGLN